MNICDYKAEFEAAMELAEAMPTGGSENAWGYFKGSLRRRLDEDYADQFSFGAHVSTQFDRAVFGNYDSLFVIGFTRLIDGLPPRSWTWSTAEIYGGFFYEMTDELRRLAATFQNDRYDLEAFYDTKEDKSSINERIDAVCVFGDARPDIWDTVRNLTPVKTITYFWR